MAAGSFNLKPLYESLLTYNESRKGLEAARLTDTIL